MNPCDCGAPPMRADLWSRWTHDPALIAALLGSLFPSNLQKKTVRGTVAAAPAAGTIRGNPKKAVGNLNNPLYVARLVWNRRQWCRSPESEHHERRYRLRDKSEWLEIHVPDLSPAAAGQRTEPARLQ